MNGVGQSVRYRAVRAKRLMLHAAIEDTVKGEITYVADASLAFYLAELLNAQEAGEPPPPPGERRHPSRFQLTHDPVWRGKGAGVVYVHGSNNAAIASSPSEETAKAIAQLMNRVDYPMIDQGGYAGIARLGNMRPAPGPLPEPSVVPIRERRKHRGTVGFALLLFLPEVAIIALIGLVSWPIAITVALVYLVGMLIFRAAVRFG